MRTQLLHTGQGPHVGAGGTANYERSAPVKLILSDLNKIPESTAICARPVRSGETSKGEMQQCRWVMAKVRHEILCTSGC